MRVGGGGGGGRCLGCLRMTCNFGWLPTVCAGWLAEGPGRAAPRVSALHLRSAPGCSFLCAAATKLLLHGLGCQADGPLAAATAPPCCCCCASPTPQGRGHLRGRPAAACCCRFRGACAQLLLPARLAATGPPAAPEATVRAPLLPAPPPLLLLCPGPAPLRKVLPLPPFQAPSPPSKLRSAVLVHDSDPGRARAARRFSRSAAQCSIERRRPLFSAAPGASPW
jgi:hypothetical protein